jgi:hypothetical protein
MRIHQAEDYVMKKLFFLSSPLSVAWDNAETAGNAYSNDVLVDLFLSSIGKPNTAYYSILHTTLENQHADSQIIPFADTELKFIQLEERHTSNGSSRRE